MRNYAVCSAAVFALASVLIGCGGNTEVGDTARNAAIYRSVIADVVDTSSAGLDHSAERPVLFIEAFEADGMTLEVQVKLVTSFIEQYDVRFIDDRDRKSVV